MPLRSPAETVHAHISAVALVAALMLVVVVASPVLALAADDLTDDVGIMIGLPGVVILIPARPGLSLPVLAKSSILLSALSLPEYLSSHFGEKRFADGSLILLSSIVPMLAALYAVPSCFSCCDLQALDWQGNPEIRRY